MRGIVSVVTLAAFATPSLAQTAAEAITKTVSYCVGEVHKSGFQRFDAFYNPATGLVENNAFTVGDQNALYVFRKCMAAQGIPLGQTNGTPPEQEKNK